MKFIFVGCETTLGMFLQKEISMNKIIINFAAATLTLVFSSSAFAIGAPPDNTRVWECPCSFPYFEYRSGQNCYCVRRSVVVPEPSTMALMAAGLGALVYFGTRRRKK